MPSCSTAVSGITVNKTSNVQRVTAGDVITYTVTVANTSCNDLDTVSIRDVIPPQTTLVPGSINPIPQAGETLETGVTIANVPRNGASTLTYSVTVNAAVTGAIINDAQAVYHYRDSCGSDHYDNMYSPQSVISVTNTAGPEVTVTKFADRRTVSKNCEILVYTVTVENTGIVDVDNIVVIDPIPYGMKYVENSTVIDGGQVMNQNPANGILLGTLSVGEPATTIQYQVCVVNLTNTTFVSQAIVNGTYTLNGLTQNIEEVSNVLSIAAAPSTTSIGKNICRNIFAPCLKCVDDIAFSLTTIQTFASECGLRINVNYEMTVTYLDCRGNTQTASDLATVAFFVAPQDLDTSDLSVQFSLNSYKAYCNQVNVFAVVKLCGPLAVYRTDM